MPSETGHRCSVAFLFLFLFFFFFNFFLFFSKRLETKGSLAVRPETFPEDPREGFLFCFSTGSCGGSVQRISLHCRQSIINIIGFSLETWTNIVYSHRFAHRVDVFVRTRATRRSSSRVITLLNAYLGETSVLKLGDINRWNRVLCYATNRNNILSTLEAMCMLC